MDLNRRILAGADTATAGDKGKIIAAASGTWTLAFEPAATLGVGWWCYVTNEGSGVITLNPDGAETIDGSATVALEAGGTRLVSCDGVSALRTSFGLVAEKVKGPTSATDNAIARFDGTTGKVVQNSVVTIDDAGAVSGLRIGTHSLIGGETVTGYLEIVDAGGTVRKLAVVS